MIISLFGPDGVGKSTASKKLAELGWTVFSGTNIAEWPDLSWHEYFTARNIDESSLNEDAHFVEKIERVYALAKKLDAANEIVVIDSDPLHKTLIHDYLRSLPDVAEARKRMRQRLNDFKHLIDYDQHNSVHVSFQVSNQLSIREQASICLERLANRSSLAFFDPKNLSQSIARLEATNELNRLLREDDDKLLAVETFEPFDVVNFKTNVQHLVPHC